MITFKQLQESMTTSYPYVANTNTMPGQLKYDFQDAAGTNYVVICNFHTPSQSMSVSFFITEGNRLIGNSLSAALTGTSPSSIKVFSTTAVIIRDVWRKHKLLQISFSGKTAERTRIRLYSRLAAMVAKEIGGEVTIEESIGTTYFKIHKANHK